MHSPIVIISPTTTNTAAQFVLPQFVGGDHELSWWTLAGVWLIVASVVAARSGVDLSRERGGRWYRGPEASETASVDASATAADQRPAVLPPQAGWRHGYC